MKVLKVGNIKIGGTAPFVLIAGPCVIENLSITLVIAEKLKEITERLNIPLIFKASYDKANRSSIKSYRGTGIKKGLKILKEVKEKVNLPVLTDVHCREEVQPTAEVADVIQIPAFLSRQTDLLIETAKTKRVVNIKKGQFLSPWELKNSIDKVKSQGNEKILITERGTTFGYNNLVVDFRAFPIMRSFGYPVIFDITHSLQLPGGQGTCSGGQSQFAEPLARAAVAAGIDGLFIEVHPEPEKALCDGPNSLKLDDIPEFLKPLIALDAVVKKS